MPDVTLKDYIERIIDERHQLYETKFEAHQLALALAKAEIDRRLEQMNNFREEQRMDALAYPSRKEWEIGHESVLRRIAFLEKTTWVGMGALAILAFAAKLIWK